MHAENSKNGNREKPCGKDRRGQTAFLGQFHRCGVGLPLSSPRLSGSFGFQTGA
jgi:hypothetical protein